MTMGRKIFGLCATLAVAALIAVPAASAEGRHGYRGHKGHHKHHGGHDRHGRKHHGYKGHHYGGRKHGYRKGHHGKHHGGHLAYPLIHLFAYALTQPRYHAPAYHAEPAPRYRPARPCQRVVKDAYDAYGAPVLLGGTMCYDPYDRPYIVRGSRRVIRRY